MAADHIVVLDQGTTSTRAIAFDRTLVPVAEARRQLTQHYPADGQVEHDANEIWAGAQAVLAEAIGTVGGASRVAGIAITNQRETSIAFDRKTGAPRARAIVWQDRRTADLCAALKGAGVEPMVQARTGLLLDPYFSATKFAWLLAHGAGGPDLALSTVDGFLVHRLTGGARFATDATNAARTLLFDINRQVWDCELCDLFAVPMDALPEVRDSADDFGATDLFGAPIPILAVAGDQQAALIGQGCITAGDAKATYGTGCFLVAHTGDAPVVSTNRLLATVAWRLAGKPAYALEGSIFNAGTVAQWLRDEMGFVAASSETEALAAQAPEHDGVYAVPAFTGLGAPHWRPDARGALFGLTRATGRASIARACLDAVAWQTADLLETLAADGAPVPSALKIDGGMSQNGWFRQRLADLAGVTVVTPAHAEMTALGAAALAALRLGWIGSLAEHAGRWREAAHHAPMMAEVDRALRRDGWRRAVAATLAFSA